jgi:hypothetical protein
MNERDIGGEKSLEGRNEVAEEAKLRMMDAPTASITIHASKRISQRQGLRKRSFHRRVEKALQFGMGVNDTRGNLRKYLYNLSINTILYGKEPKVLVHSGHVYIFTAADVLITTWPLPKEFTRQKPQRLRDEED